MGVTCFTDRPRLVSAHHAVFFVKLSNAEQYFPVVLSILCNNVVLTFHVSVDQRMQCDLSTIEQYCNLILCCRQFSSF